MENYSEIPKFNTIANINLTFITEVILATVRINVLLVTIHECFFFFFFFFMTVENRERDRNSNRRPQRDRHAPNYTFGGAACRDLVKNRWVDMGMCLSACFSFPLQPLL